MCDDTMYTKSKNTQNSIIYCSRYLRVESKGEGKCGNDKHQTQDTGYLLGGAGGAGESWEGNAGAPKVSVKWHVQQLMSVIPSLPLKAGVRVLNAKRRKALDTVPCMQPAPEKSQLE